MHRLWLALALLSLVSSCQCGGASAADGGAGGGGVGGGEGGGAGGTAADSGSPDSGLSDAGLDAGPGLDPALCPLGVADGCCPLLVHGGTDPDCKPLSCTTLVESAVIDLPDDPWSGWQGQVGLAWTGRELVLARTAQHASTQSPTSEVITEHFALDGGLLSSNHVPAPSALSTGATSLAYDPVSRTFAFAHTLPQAVEVLGLDGAGAVRWSTPGHVICNGIDGILQVDAAQGRFVVSGTNYTCAGSTGVPVAYGLDADGGRLFQWELSNDSASWHSSAACDEGCAHLLTQWFPSLSGVVHGNLLEPADGGPEGGFSMLVDASYGGIDHTALASNGTEFFSMLAVVTSASGDSNLRFQKFAGTQRVGQPVTLSGQRALPPSAIWTGDGWLIAASTFTLSTSYAFPTDNSDYDITMYHFDPSGALRSSWLFERHAYAPRLVWAGGRIAMGFTRAGLGAPETRHLVFFDCP